MKTRLLAGAADRATMVDGCPLGKVAEQTSRAIFGTSDVRLNPFDEIHEQRLYAQSANLKNRGY